MIYGYFRRGYSQTVKIPNIKEKNSIELYILLVLLALSATRLNLIKPRVRIIRLSSFHL